MNVETRKYLESLGLNKNASEEEAERFLLDEKSKNNQRDFSLNLQKSSTIDEKTRSIDMISATENPVRVYDWDEGFIDEILLMSGLELPENRQVPLQNSHNRWDLDDTIGSYRDMRIEDSKVVGRAYFADVDSVEEIWIKVRDGHITDCSVGWCPLSKPIIVPENETISIEGREFTGPLKVVTKWKIIENSVCAIGADKHAKARSNKTNTGENRAMDKETRRWLERQGLDIDASDEEARAFLEGISERKPQKQQEPEKEIDSEKITIAERERISEITSLCRSFGFDEMEEDLIKDGKSMANAREKILEKLKNSDEPSGYGHRPEISVGRDEREKFRAAAQSGLMMMAGIPEEKPAEGANELAGYTQVELARMSLERSGQSTRGNKMEMVGRALVTTDLPVILGNVANLSLMQGWQAASETWETFCSTGNVSDFKTHTSARPSELGDLEEVKEGDEYKYDKISEEMEQYHVATFGKVFAITRQSIINDDLNVLSSIPMLYGESAARKIGDIAYSALTSPAKMGDGKDLFSAIHKNILTAAAIGTASLSESIKMMKGQKDIQGKRRLNIRPQFILAPNSLEGAAEEFFASSQFNDTDKSATRTNIYAGTRFTRIYDGRLDDSSETAWYVAGPKQKTVKVFFLNGVRTPYMEAKNGFNVDGVEYKVRIDAGAKAMDWRGLQKNDGV